MEELMELRQLLEAGHLPEAMLLLDEMDEMAKDDKINKIESHLMILLLHLIKQAAEKHSTRSWNVSIRNATHSVVRSWKRRKTGGYYLTEQELRDAIDESYSYALGRAATEAFGGAYTEKQLASMIDGERIRKEAARRLFRPEEANNDIDTDNLEWLK